MKWHRNWLGVVFFFGSVSQAWEYHGLATWAALHDEVNPALSRSVPVETLELFLRSESAGLERLLDQEEVWAESEVAYYPKRPIPLRFAAKSVDSFLKALRINPRIKLRPTLHLIAGGSERLKALPYLEMSEVSIVPHTIGPHPKFKAFVALPDGFLVSPKEILASACDEPDYGFDIGLWSDNPGEMGKLYQWGKQPFGNPTLEFGSQAPFHMGFYHEAELIFRMARNLRRTYPEVRVHQFLSLARYAYERGHFYWAWRFAGWGLHYIQDLTQPYHSTVLPGVSVPRVLFAGFLKVIGIVEPYNDFLQLVTNEHLALEDYGYRMVSDGIAASLDTGGTGDTGHTGKWTDPVLLALSQAAGATEITTLEATMPRKVAGRSHLRAEAIHNALIEAMPSEIILNPKYLFGVTQPNVNTLRLVEKHADLESEAVLKNEVTQLFKTLGATTRAYVGAIPSR